MVKLNADPRAAFQLKLKRMEIIVLAPVGIGDVVAKGAAVGLARVNAGCDGNRLVGRDDEGIAAAKIAIEKVRIIADVLI